MGIWDKFGTKWDKMGQYGTNMGIPKRKRSTLLSLKCYLAPLLFDKRVQIVKCLNIKALFIVKQYIGGVNFKSVV
jgi:hypothetical protein